ncbi:MAG: IS701 family transposase [Nanoarchaeota archaeon]
MKQVLPMKIDVLNSVISFAKKCFSKPQFKQVTKYVTGLITLQKKSISSISAASVVKQDQSSLNRFLTEAEWDEQKLEDRYTRKVQHVFGREKASLVIDDSLSKKTGKHIEEVQYHKDHSGNGYVFGHQIVTALVKVRDKVFPVFPKLYSKKTESKIELAKELISYADEKLKLKEVIMDSWYMSVELIKECLKRGLDVVGCVKSNRTAYFKANEKEKLSKYYKSLKKKDFTTYIIDDATYRIHERIVRMKHIGFVKLLVSREWNADDKKWSRPFYLISANTTKSAVQIIRTYSERWSIETFHRDIKQNLGLEACQVRGRKGITRHLILVALAYAVLKFWTCFQSLTWTIGEAIRYIQGRMFDDLIITIVEENNREARWRLAEPFISKNARV